MPNDYELKNFLKTALYHAGIVSGDLPQGFFTEDEAARIKEEGLKLQSSSVWLNFLVHDVFNPDAEFRREDWPDINKIDEILTELVVSAYRIGAATWTHNANVKFVDKQLRPKKMRAAKPSTLTDRDREHRRQALEVALAEPFKKPLGKASGNSARARRLLPAFNAHLTSLGDAAVSQDVIEKMLREYPPAKSAQE